MPKDATLQSEPFAKHVTSRSPDSPQTLDSPHSPTTPEVMRGALGQRRTTSFVALRALQRTHGNQAVQRLLRDRQLGAPRVAFRATATTERATGPANIIQRVGEYANLPMTRRALVDTRIVQEYGIDVTQLTIGEREETQDAAAIELFPEIARDPSEDAASPLQQQIPSISVQIAQSTHTGLLDAAQGHKGGASCYGAAMQAGLQLPQIQRAILVLCDKSDYPLHAVLAYQGAAGLTIQDNTAQLGGMFGNNISIAQYLRNVESATRHKTTEELRKHIQQSGQPGQAMGGYNPGFSVSHIRLWEDNRLQASLV